VAVTAVTAVGEPIAAAADEETAGPVVGCCTDPVVVVAAAAFPSEVLTISCLVSEDLVPGPGFVRLIFIFKPGSTVAEWTAAAIFPPADPLLAPPPPPPPLLTVVVVAPAVVEFVVVVAVTAAALPLFVFKGDEPVAPLFGLVPLGIPAPEPC
jgi:hypothetical protein